MMAYRRDSLLQRTWDNVLLRTFLYYVFMGLFVWALWTFMPASWHAFLEKAVNELTGGGGQGRAGVSKGADMFTQAPNVSAEGELATSAALAVIAAFFIALPVAWVYSLTRAKKGYRQALAQALIVLPVVDAAVIVLVKNSLALAFSLAGIVAAVRFRNTLEDTKDAVYILVAAAIGLASGTQVPVALVLSIAFNIVTVILWYTDFGRNPAGLGGALAEERLARTREQLSHTQSFVAVMDDVLLKEMSPAQLDALADRAWRRRKKMSPDIEKQDDLEKFDTLLRVHTSQPDKIRPLVEPVLKKKVKTWRFSQVIHDSPTEHVVEFSMHLGENADQTELMAAVQNAVEETATNVELI
jgi:phage terminase small subunit